MSSVEHTTRKHAKLSASGASRWMNCTPSANLEQKFDESVSSPFAEEGTLAHEFGDIGLHYNVDLIDQKTFRKEAAKLRKHERYTDEMEEQVAKYVAHVMEALAIAKSGDGETELLIEQKFDYSHLVEGGFGTGDATVIGNGIMDVMDLKYGKGIQVEAENNPQLKLYALGALREYELMYDIHTVRLTIIQPRLNHISTWEISVEELESWGEHEVKPKAKMAHAGKGLQCAGDWCRWCKVKPMCATLAAKNVKLAQHEFKDPSLLSESQLIDIYKQIPMLTDWANSVSKYLLEEAVKGKNWPGYKVVEGRSLRKWTNPKEVESILTKNAFSTDQFRVTKLDTITGITKLVGKDRFNAMFSKVVEKPVGKPTLAPQSDKRQPFGLSAYASDFD